MSNGIAWFDWLIETRSGYDSPGPSGSMIDATSVWSCQSFDLLSSTSLLESLSGFRHIWNVGFSYGSYHWLDNLESGWDSNSPSQTQSIMWFSYAISVRVLTDDGVYDGARRVEQRFFKAVHDDGSGRKTVHSYKHIRVRCTSFGYSPNDGFTSAVTEVA